MRMLNGRSVGFAKFCERLRAGRCRHSARYGRPVQVPHSTFDRSSTCSFTISCTAAHSRLSLHLIEVTELSNLLDSMPQTTNGWTYNFRSYDCTLESDDEDYPGNSGTENADSVADDLDLSRRTDTVDYKPNPWTIAKLNAASRGMKAPNAARDTADPMVDVSAASLKPSGIANAFQRQEKIAQAASSNRQLGLKPQTLPVKRKPEHRALTAPRSGVIQKSLTKSLTAEKSPFNCIPVSQINLDGPAATTSARRDDLGRSQQLLKPPAHDLHSLLPRQRTEAHIVGQGHEDLLCASEHGTTSPRSLLTIHAASTKVTTSSIAKRVIAYMD